MRATVACAARPNGSNSSRPEVEIWMGFLRRVTIMRSLSISSDIWRRRGGRGRGGGAEGARIVYSSHGCCTALGCGMNIFFLPRGAALLHGERDETSLLHRSIRTGFFVPLRSNNALQIAFLRASVIDHPSADSSLARRGAASPPPPLLPVTRSPHIYHLPHICQDPSKRVSYFDTVLLLIGTWCHYKGTL